MNPNLNLVAKESLNFFHEKGQVIVSNFFSSCVVATPAKGAPRLRLLEDREHPRSVLISENICSGGEIRSVTLGEFFMQVLRSLEILGRHFYYLSIRKLLVF